MTQLRLKPEIAQKGGYDGDAYQYADQCQVVNHVTVLDCLLFLEMRSDWLQLFVVVLGVGLRMKSS